MERTKWLDSLRGIAAAIVAFDRLFMDEMTFPFRSYWALPAMKNRYFMQLPPFRIIFGAKAMATLFFVISGYALSINHLRARQRRQQHFGQMEFVNQVASAATRRFFRLYLPVIAIACISQFFFFVNLYTFPNVSEIKHFYVAHRIHPWSSLWDHIKFLFQHIVDIINPFNDLQPQKVNFGLNRQFSTMPAEFRGSCLVYFLVVIMAPWKAQGRLIILGVVSAYLLLYGMWEIATFIGGLWLAELKVIEESGSESGSHSRHFHFSNQAEEDSDEENINSTLLQSSSLSTLSTPLTSPSWSKWSDTVTDSKKKELMTPPSIMKLIVFILGIHLMCLPEKDGHLTTGYRGLIIIQPSTWETWEIIQYSWKSIGAFMTVYGISTLPRWVFQRPLESFQFLQYLSRISFSLYLVQQIVFYLWREAVKNWIWEDLTGYGYPGDQLADREPFARMVMWAGSTLILAPVMVFLADEFMRHVEIPCMAATRDFEKWLFGSQGST